MGAPDDFVKAGVVEVTDDAPGGPVVAAEGSDRRLWADGDEAGRDELLGMADLR